MVDYAQTEDLKLMSHDEIVARGWFVPSIEQFSANMEKRLKKVRSENTDNESFLLRHNYKNNTNCCQA